MNDRTSRVYDEFARLFTDAASVAQGVKREAETLFKTQAERFINEMNLVRREDFDVVREMAIRARAENAELSARIAALEAKLGEGAGPAARPAPRRRSAGSAARTRRVVAPETASTSSAEASDPASPAAGGAPPLPEDGGPGESRT